MTTIAAVVVDCCGDSDPATRKFACFAVGNAAFHDASLYALLSPAIPALKRALHDVDDKTRANASGALGNLGRNSGELAKAMAAQHVPHAILQIVLTGNGGDGTSSPEAEADYATFGSQSPNISSKRTALFSLGTLAAYASCRDSLLSCKHPSLHDLFDRVALMGKGGPGVDETLTKYLIRLKTKLKSRSQPL